MFLLVPNLQSWSKKITNYLQNYAVRLVIVYNVHAVNLWFLQSIYMTIRVAANSCRQVNQTDWE
jgi:hypothetical protein